MFIPIISHHANDEASLSQPKLNLFMRQYIELRYAESKNAGINPVFEDINGESKRKLNLLYTQHKSNFFSKVQKPFPSVAIGLKCCPADHK